MDYQGYVQHVQHQVTVLGEMTDIILMTDVDVTAEPPRVVRHPASAVVTVPEGESVMLR